MSYFVYVPKYHRTGELTTNGNPVFLIEMVRRDRLEATGPESALIEAKALGYIGPIVGMEKA